MSLHQAAIFAERFAEFEQKAAKQRQKEGQKSGGRGKKKLAGKLPASKDGESRK